ncbi:heparinase [Planctomycetota bacterium]|nr:heparinase [Planctomycetota bacterium]
MLPDDAVLVPALAAHARDLPWPVVTDRRAWQTACAGVRGEQILHEAEIALSEPWPALPATGHLENTRSGRRSVHETPMFLRRRRLAWLVLAAGMTDQERFHDAVIDALWSICEESTWCSPAHSGQAKAERTPLPLPVPGAAFVDLFVAETAAVVAVAGALLAPRLDAVTPAIRQRIAHECRVRLVDPLLRDRSQWWRHGINNWTPWIAANAVLAAGQVEADPAVLAVMIGDLADACGRYRDRLPADGGCDEGVGYWNVGPVKLLEFAERVDRACGGAGKMLDDPRLRAAALFPLRVHLGQGRFPTFSDCKPGDAPRRGALWKLGTALQLPVLCDLARLAARGWDPAGEVDDRFDLGNTMQGGGGHLLTALDHLFLAPAAELAAPPTIPPMAADDWFPDLQWLIARGDRLVLAAKAGHNSENHNHNDVGQAMVLLDGIPLLVDAGTGSYTTQSFGPRRYELWYNRGSGHGVPVVGGVEQSAGRRFTPDETAALMAGGPFPWDARPFSARNVVCTTGVRSELAMELVGCYPAEAGLLGLHRRIALDRERSQVDIRDAISVRQPTTVTMTLLAAVEPRRTAHGVVLTTPGGACLAMEFVGWQVAAIEPVDLSGDAWLREGWGALWRIELRAEVGHPAELAVIGRAVSDRNSAIPAE